MPYGSLDSLNKAATRPRHKLVFAYAVLLGVLSDQLLRVSARTAVDQACWVCSVGALDLFRVVRVVAWFAGAGGWFGALQQAVRADGQALQDVFV